MKRAIDFHCIPRLRTRGAKPPHFRNLTRCLNQYLMRRKLWDLNINWERRALCPLVSSVQLRNRMKQDLALVTTEFSGRT